MVYRRYRYEISKDEIRSSNTRTGKNPFTELVNSDLDLPTDRQTDMSQYHEGMTMDTRVSPHVCALTRPSPSGSDAGAVMIPLYCRHLARSHRRYRGGVWLAGAIHHVDVDGDWVLGLI